MYFTPKACPYYGQVKPHKCSSSISFVDCSDLINEIDFYLRRSQKSSGGLKDKAQKLIRYWMLLDFNESVSHDFKKSGIKVLKTICAGQLIGFDAEFVLHSAIGYFNQNFRCATNFK